MIGFFNFSSISWIGYVWIYKVLFFTFPVSFFLAMFFLNEFMFDAIRAQYRKENVSKCAKIICGYPFAVFMVLCVIGMS